MTNTIDELETTRQACSYFRMGLVTGLVEIETLIDWADRQITLADEPDGEVITLALSGRLPHSQLIWLLSQFEGAPDYGRPLDLLLARAAALLHTEPDRLEEIIMGLRLLNYEEYFPAAIGRQIAGLQESLETWRRGRISHDQLAAAGNDFLGRYRTSP